MVISNNHTSDCGGSGRTNDGTSSATNAELKRRCLRLSLVLFHLVLAQVSEVDLLRAECSSSAGGREVEVVADLLPRPVLRDLPPVSVRTY